MIFVGLGLATDTPESLAEVVIVVKGWIDAAILIAVGTTVFLGGVRVFIGARK